MAGRPVGTAYRAVQAVGHQVSFAVGAVAAVPFALLHYRRQIALQIRHITWGAGGIVVGGGTAIVLLLIGAAVGGAIGIIGVMFLNMVGMGPLAGFVSAYGNTREIGPMIVALGFAAQAGCRITAELGSMRISEEIDALEAISVRPLPFVVTTRLIATVATIVPFYVFSLTISYASASIFVQFLHSETAGTYQHYFRNYLSGNDIGLSLVKAVIFVAAVVLIHCYQGFYAVGGPVAVGEACGRAIRASLVVIVVLDMMLTLLFWGTDTGIRISG
ncbi:MULTISPECIES: ABC transporter permease [Nocardia]